jgi:hypothetical protein
MTLNNMPTHDCYDESTIICYGTYDILTCQVCGITHTEECPFPEHMPNVSETL